MHTADSFKRAFFRRLIATVSIAALLGPTLLLIPERVRATSQTPRATIAVSKSQPAGSGIGLTIGLTRNGDGSTCGTATSVEANVGDMVDICYTVANHSSIDLAYSTLLDSVDGTPLDLAPTAIAAGASYVYHRQIRARTSSVHDTTWIAQDDLARYASDDSPPLDFIDIRSTGTAFDMDAWGAEKEIDIPFAFTFYGVPSTRFCVSNQGFIRTEVSSCYSQLYSVYENFQLTWMAGIGLSPFSDGSFIVPYWDNFDNVQGGVYWQVQGEAPNRKLIVQWDRAHVGYVGPTYDPTGTPGRANLEAILGEDGSIAFQYENTTFDWTDFAGNPDIEFDDGRSATIGVSASAANGGGASQYSYNTLMAHPAPSSIVWNANTPTLYSANASVELDVGGPALAPSPSLIAATAPSGSTAPVAATLAIGNDGNRALDWSVTAGSQPAGFRPLPSRRAAVADWETAQPRSERTSKRQSSTSSTAVNGGAYAAPPVTAGTNCGPTVEGVVIHDDGVAINGYAGGVDVDTVAVDKFTPTYYPATFASVCVAFDTYSDPASPAGPVDYEVVVYDDTGVNGGPGNELGAVSATTTSTAYPNPAVFYSTVDISGLGIDLVSGSVYIGVRWNPDQSPNYTVFLYADDDTTDGLPPPNLPEAGYFDTGDGVFVPTLSVFDGYKAMMVRAVETAPGCTDLENVPWLSLSAASGSVPVGGAPSTVDLTLNPSGLANGVHTANICIASGYETIAVPVQFAIGTNIPLASLGSVNSFDFSLPPDGTSSATLTLTNSGTSGSLLNYTITETSGDCSAASDVPWLQARPAQGAVRVGSPASIQVNVDAGGLGGGAHAARLCIATNDAAHPQLEVPVALAVNLPDAVFADGFDNGQAPGVYDTREEFLAHVQAGYYEESFTSVPSNEAILSPMQFSSEIPGLPPLAYTIYTQDDAQSGLYNFPGVISHNNSGDQIVITFVTPVTAIGGNFWESNMFGEESNGPIWLTLSDGTFEPIGATWQAISFRGFITASPITRITIDSPNGEVSWAKLDNLIVGYKN